MLLCALLHAVPPPASADATADAKLAALQQAIETTPDNQALFIERASVFVDNGQMALARRDLRVAETLGNPLEPAYVHGVLLYREADFAGARVQFDNYLKVHPEHLPSLDYRARLLRDAGDYEAALADYRRLMAADDALAPGYYLAVAQIMSALPDHGTADALAFLDDRMREVGPVSPLQRYAIELEQSRGDYAGAIRRLAALDQKLRATPEWKAEMAELQLLAGQPDEALLYISLAREQLTQLKRTAARQRLADELEVLERRALKAAAHPSR